MIYVLSAPIRTGKTMALLQWVNNRADVDGLLCPDDNHGKRFFLEIKSKNTFQLQVDPSTADETIPIGPFVFLKSAFRKANAFLLTFSFMRTSNYLVIDELGKLELKNKGLHESAKVLIPIYETQKNTHLILVIRDTLLNLVIAHYNISQYQLLKPTDLKSNLF